MLYWALVFLVIAILAGLLGFGAIAFAAAGIAKIIFCLFLILFSSRSLGTFCKEPDAAELLGSRLGRRMNRR